MTVTDICKATGFEQSRVSHNLRCLENCGFVEVRVDGNYRTYSLDGETIRPIIDLFNMHVNKYKKRLESCGVMEK